MEQGEEEARKCLQRKLQILEQIAAKTETLSRFVPDRKITGLGRVLRERKALIDELAVVHAQIANNPAWKHEAGLATLVQEATGKHREVLERSHQVLQQAMQEKTRMASEIRSSKLYRHARSQYVTPWRDMMAGCRFNTKG
ncbi:hypothetical protein [Sporomusa acidovorans]|uniref:FlgN protein n=1 Tax=Sporomusa acidovorans (strain ATCC 49682 / DSM 3132 / Mol) TaxID=1123286 RepID=A0ABZ3IYF4_SPOA4|nr:hypothetical protein [Sporomusa acidovorans]OZC22414.1 hypothetical protein SPACI_14630 [Sporomusa acidovorans DSM 3132]SDE48560.1 hypothetical protein SAMN04488499_101487 [Sporomusa acidovorans]